MTWEIVAGLITLAGAVGMIVSWSSKLTKSIASLQTTIELLGDAFRENREHAHETHQRLFDVAEENRLKIANHEGRILVLEKEVKGK